jgi:hypothetical protein
LIEQILFTFLSQYSQKKKSNIIIFVLKVIDYNFFYNFDLYFKNYSALK